MTVRGDDADAQYYQIGFDELPIAEVNPIRRIARGLAFRKKRTPCCLCNF